MPKVHIDVTTADLKIHGVRELDSEVTILSLFKSFIKGINAVSPNIEEYSMYCPADDGEMSRKKYRVLSSYEVPIGDLTRILFVHNATLKMKRQKDTGSTTVKGEATKLSDKPIDL